MEPKEKVFVFKSCSVFQPLSKKRWGRKNNGFHLDVKVVKFDSKAKGGGTDCGMGLEGRNREGKRSLRKAVNKFKKGISKRQTAQDKGRVKKSE